MSCVHARNGFILLLLLLLLLPLLLLRLPPILLISLFISFIPFFVVSLALDVGVEFTVRFAEIANVAIGTFVTLPVFSQGSSRILPRTDT